MLNALSFTAPLMLIALAALPLIWLLLRATPPAPSTLAFPAFMLLRDLQNEKETPDRTPWWLLLLRMILAALIILGLAGPVLNAPPPAPGAGPLVLAVDDTWTAAQGWTARRDAVAAAAAEAAQNDRPFFLITTAPAAEPRAAAPIPGEEARDLAATLAPRPFAADRAAAAERLAALDSYLENAPAAEIRWLTDNVAGEGNADDVFAAALAERGALTVIADRDAPRVMLRFREQTSDGLAFSVARLNPEDPWEGTLVATARDGRELARAPAEAAAGARETEIMLELPLALRNDVMSVRIEGALSAGALWLADARERRALVGLVADADRGRNNLLSGAHYVRQALDPYAAFLEDTLEGVLASDASVIVLNDIGRLRARDEEALAAWVERGGVLIRFAGPALAEAAQDETPPLLPTRLRGGGRAFGGALTWETPQKLDAFAAESPFSGLAPPDDVLIRRQVLAQPGGETTERTWARLEDGTPLVTGARRGAGVIALFHVTATPGWSDLPLSGLFVEMLRRLTFLSTLGPESAPDNTDNGAEARYAPLRLMDGFGRLARPGDNAPPLTLADLAAGPAAERRPGLYGPPEAPFALNAVGADTAFEPLSLPGYRTAPYEARPPEALSPPLFALALALLLIDGIVTMMLTGRLPGWRRRHAPAAAAALAAFLSVSVSIPQRAGAQPLDPPLSSQTVDAALTTRLAYVKTDDPEMDRLSSQALSALSRELARRTAVEPAPPDKVDLETDDLSIYPFLYWPIVPGAEPPSDAALANIENFMRFGGLILFDTRDAERSVGAGSTPESRAFQTIIAQIDIPPLTPVGGGHVLSRSFYLMDDLTGRAGDSPVWVQAAEDGANDGVTPVIIGGRDWAGAWATDSFGRPLRPMGRSGGITGERARELAYRAGVNMVMVALTGNYKSDQVHTPILLERLGQ